MAKLKIHNLDEFENLKGLNIPSSNWFKISQSIIDNFAKATLDDQWIHVNKSKCITNSPFGSTIAHGYLTLSLIPHFINDILEVKNILYYVNYGIEKLKFKSAIKVDSEIRLNLKIDKVKDLGNICQVYYFCTIYTKDEEKIALEAYITYLYYFTK